MFASWGTNSFTLLSEVWLSLRRFHETRNGSGNVAGYVMQRMISSSDEQCRKWGQLFIYACKED